MGFTIFIIFISGVALYLCGALYNVVIMVKAWLLSKPQPDLDDGETNLVSRIVSRKSGCPVWTIDLAARCFQLWLVPTIVVIAYHVTWFLLSIIAVAVIVGGLYFTKRVIRIRRELSEFTSKANAHEEKT